MTQILTHQQIRYKIERIAYQIYESHLGEKSLILAGIEGNGYYFAQEILSFLSQFSNLEVILAKVFMDKKNPLLGVSCDIDCSVYTGQNIVLVDDVLNSGSTLIYGAMYFLSTSVKQLKTAVLVNRNHKKFPIKADFKGVSLSTSLCDNVEVRFEDGLYSAWLN